MIFGRTGEQCAISGKYRCFGNYDVQVLLNAGELFPVADDSLNVFWMLAGRIEESPVKKRKRKRDIYS